MLQFITRDHSSPNGKQRVFFCTLPGQQDYLLQEISQDIFDHCHCAIWYEDGIDTDFSLLEENITLSALMVLEVNKELFQPDNPIRERWIPLAQKHRVPILPLLENPVLLDLFNAHFTNIQVLNRFDPDKTALPYHQKLQRFLQDVMVRDDMTERIEKAFSARAFLSYRKVDRKLARELLRHFAEDPVCRGIAFWYDEFLRPGEDFSKSIQNAIDQSDHFILALTNHMTVDGNYVVTQEYPYAQRAQKSILPVLLEAVPPDLVQARFPGIPKSVSFRSALETLGQQGAAERTAEQNYLLAMAYLQGLHQDKNTDVAIQLLTQSVQAGYAPAALALSNIPCPSDSPQQAQERRLHWLNQHAALRQNDFRADPNEASVRGFADAMERLATALIQYGDTQKGFTRFEQARNLLSTFRMDQEHAQCCANFGSMLSQAGRYQDALQMLHCALQYHISMSKQSSSYALAHCDQIALCCFCAGYAAANMENWSLAKGMTETAVRNYARLFQNSPEDYVLDLSHSYDNLAIIHRHLWEQTNLPEELDRALNYNKQAQAVLKTMAQRKPDTFEPEHAEVCVSLSAIHMRAGQLEQAQQTATQAIDILRRYNERYDGLYSNALASALGNRSGAYFQAHLYTEALADLQESEVLFRSLPHTEEKLALVFWNMGNAYSCLKQHDNALQCYPQALALYDQLPEGSVGYNYGLCCHSYALSLYRCDRYTEALQWIETACRFFRKLQEKTPQAYQHIVDSLEDLQAHILDITASP